MNKTKKIIAMLSSRRKDLLNGDLTNGICYDGIVNEAVYDAQKVKVAVLLKETNGSDSSGDTTVSRKDWLYNYWIKHQQAEGEPEVCVTKYGDTYVKEDPFYSYTFRKLCLWLSILFEKLEDTYEGYEKYFVNSSVDVQTVRKVLHRVAVLNLKKTWGDAETDTNSLREYLENPKALQTVEEQLFEIVKPEIVLCGSSDVFDVACEKFGGTAVNSDKYDLFNNPYRIAVIKGVLFVSMYHPTYQGGKTDVQFAKYAEELFDIVKLYLVK